MPKIRLAIAYLIGQVIYSGSGVLFQEIYMQPEGLEGQDRHGARLEPG